MQVRFPSNLCETFVRERFFYILVLFLSFCCVSLCSTAHTHPKLQTNSRAYRKCFGCGGGQTASARHLSGSAGLYAALLLSFSPSLAFVLSPFSFRLFKFVLYYVIFWGPTLSCPDSSQPHSSPHLLRGCSVPLCAPYAAMCSPPATSPLLTSAP